MKLSSFSRLLLGCVLAAAFLRPSWAQNQSQWMDSILPADHLLENLPWMDEDGKIDSKGLFDFEDIRGIGQKDLLLIYRQSAPVDELDKPHNQTFNVCFYDPQQKKYEKSFQDEGGTVQWIRLLKIPEKKAPLLIFQRDDLKGNQALKGFVFEDGKMKQVLDATAAQVFPRFEGIEIWCSSKTFPKDKSDSEHVLAWDNTKDQFIESKPAAGGLAGWSGASILPPEEASTTKPATVASIPTEKTPKSSHHSAKGWWDEPLDAQASLTKLNTEMVPQLIKKGQIVVLGQKAGAFFTELQKEKTPSKDIKGMRASYYAAVASTLLDMGLKKDASYYLKIAFSFQADNTDALAVKAKLQP